VKGKVWLVGAGPGDPELLTVRAVRLLQAADVILHDDLVPATVLALASHTALVHNVGKRCGRKAISQDRINHLMIASAKAGMTVVRLKSGDPLIFGRAGEEMDALKRAGVEFEIVPGITAACAAASVAGISLTDRRYASQLLFTTAHRKDGAVSLEWAKAITPETTVVVYMPGGVYRDLAAALAERGFGPQTPCLVASGVSRDAQQLQWTDLTGLETFGGAAAPAVLIIGQIARHAAEELTSGLWFQPEQTDDQPTPEWKGNSR
jgi:uroporphyrin-III C-methyltransferase